MSQEQFSNQELSPQQRRIKQAENSFLNARSIGFPEPLAIQHAAKWNAMGVERDQIPQQAWKKLASYIDAGSMNHPTHAGIMQAAIEKRLAEKTPETYSEPDPKKEEVILELLSEPEFTENKQPFVDLAELYEEFKTIAKKYSPSIASDYWLFTRNVSPLIESQLKNAISWVLTEDLGNTMYQELSAYLGNRAIQELRFDQGKEMPKHVEELTLEESFTKNNAINKEKEAQLQKQRETIMQKPVNERSRDKNSIVLKNILNQIVTNNSAQLLEMPKNNTSILEKIAEEEFQNLPDEIKQYLDALREDSAIDTGRRESALTFFGARLMLVVIEKRKELRTSDEEKPTISSEYNKQLDAFIDEIVRGILPLAEEETDIITFIDDFVAEHAEEEFLKLPMALQEYLQPDPTETAKSGAQKLAIKLTYALSSAIPRQPKAEKKSWWKRLFNRDQ